MAINQEKFDQLIEDLKNNRPNPRIRDGKANLFDMDLNDTDIEKLCEVLESNTTVRELDLSQNNIGPKGAKALADTLHKKVKNGTEKLVCLDLRLNHIGSQGTAAIANALFDSQKVEKIELYGNNICKNGTKPCDKGIEATGQLLLHNSSLIYLDISSTGINAESIEPIAKALGVNTTLQCLSISYNKIGAKGITKIAEALKKNRQSSALKYIYIDETCQDHQKEKENEAIRTLATATYLLQNIDHSGTISIADDQEIQAQRQWLESTYKNLHTETTETTNDGEETNIDREETTIKEITIRASSPAGRMAAIKSRRNKLFKLAKLRNAPPNITQPGANQQDTLQPNNPEPDAKQPRNPKRLSRRL